MKVISEKNSDVFLRYCQENIFLDEGPLALVFVANPISNDSRVLKTAQSLKDDGYSCLLVGLTRDGYEVDDYHGIPLFRFPQNAGILNVKDGGRWQTWAENIADRLTGVLSSYPWSVVYTHDMWAFPLGYRLVNARRSKGSKVYWVHDIHEDVFGYENVLSPDKIQAAQAIEQRYIKSPDQLVTVNEALAQNIAERYGYERIIEVLYNCPQTSYLDDFNGSIRKSLNLDEQVFVGVYSGKANKWRGLDVIVPVLENISDLHIAILSNSDVDYIEQLLKSARSAGVSDRLHVVSQIPHYLVSEYLSDADFGLSLLAGYGNTENCVPTKIPEYMHAQLPVVVSNRLLQAEFVNKHGFGVVVLDERNSEEVADAIRQVRLKKKFFQGKLTAELLAEFSWEKQFHSVSEVIKKRRKLSYSGIDSSVRVFQGPGSNAGQPSALAKSLRGLGLNATAVCVSPVNKFGYGADHVWPAVDESSMAALAHWSLDNFDLLHYHARPIMWNFKDGVLRMPSMADMVAAKAAGKTVVFSFRGGEARIYGEFAKLSPYAWPQDKDYADFLSDEEKRFFIDAVCQIADVVTVTDPELASYVPGAVVLPRSIDCTEWPYVGPVNRERPLVVHAPSRELVKGSDYVLAAIQSLKDEGVDFDFKLIQNLTNEEAKEVYKEADIIIDQLRIGWYGVLAVEGMALGKTVISYIREDIVDFFDGPAPLVNANPMNITKVLKKCILDAELRESVGRNARRFCEDYHDHPQVAKRLVMLYEKAKIQSGEVPHNFINFALNSGLRHKIAEIQAIKMAKNIKLMRAQLKGAVLPKATPVLVNEIKSKEIHLSKGRKKLFDPPYNKIFPRVLRRIGLRK